jgi:SAM-dependent methyltransferase
MNDQAMVDAWSGAAPYWEKHRDTIRQLFSPVTGALAADAHVAPGDTVLDIATGPGEPALSIAALVGPAGKVVGIDPVTGMVEAARRAAQRLTLNNAQFEIASADRLPFSDAAFDAIVSRFGAMFFPSPVGAVHEMLRVLKRGRRLALAVWHTPETNPFLSILQQVVARYDDSPPDPSVPDAYRFAEPGKLRDILREGGACDAAERLFEFKIEAPVAVEDFWNLRCEMSEKLREKFGKLSPEQFAEAKHLSLQALRAYETPAGMSFPAQVLIVSGGCV